MLCSRIILLILLSACSGTWSFSLFDEQSSYVQFEGWRARTDGRIRVRFRCKTDVKSGLLFYVEDPRFDQYLTLYLRNGFLLMELSDGVQKPLTAQSKMAINDLRWKKVEVDLFSHHAVFRLDNAMQAEFNVSRELLLRSDIFIGGFPNSFDLFSMKHFQAMFERRFVGCVEDVRFLVGNSSIENRAVVVKSSGLSDECKDTCKPANPCLNNGICINKFAMAQCVCTRTGYRGQTCEKEAPVFGFTSSYPAVIFNVPSSLVDREKKTSVFMRFRTTSLNGIFFYTAHAGDYILLELTNGRVSVSLNLGSGSVTLATKRRVYNDNQWHSVKLERVQRLVNLTVDDLDVANGETPGLFTMFNVPDERTSFVLGGVTYEKQARMRSVSNTNFTGCLQEFIFNDYDLFWQFDTSAKEVELLGSTLKGCPQVTTKSRETRTTVMYTPNMDSPHSEQSNVYSTETFKKPDIFPSSSTSSSSCHSGRKSCLLTLAAAFSIPVTYIHGSLARIVPSPSITSQSGPTSTNGKLRSTDIRLLKVSNSPADGRLFTVMAKVSGANKIQDTPNEPFSTGSKMYRSVDAQRTTGRVLMVSNERTEGDLTLCIILAAVIGFLAFLLAVLIIVKVNAASRKKYDIKVEKDGKKVCWNDMGSFQSAPKASV